MNRFIILNWYHYDLNYRIINYLRNDKKIKKIDKKKINKERMEFDFKLKVKND